MRFDETRKGSRARVAANGVKCSGTDGKWTACCTVPIDRGSTDIALRLKLTELRSSVATVGMVAPSADLDTTLGYQAESVGLWSGGYICTNGKGQDGTRGFDVGDDLLLRVLAGSLTLIVCVNGEEVHRWVVQAGWHLAVGGGYYSSSMAAFEIVDAVSAPRENTRASLN